MRALHLALYARLDVAVKIEFLDFNVEHVGDAGEAGGRIEDAEQFLLFLDAHLQIRGDGVGELRRLIHANCGDDGFVVE